MNADFIICSRVALCEHEATDAGPRSILADVRLCRRCTAKVEAWS